MDKQEYREIVGDIRRAYDLKEYDKVLMYADELDMRRVSDSRVLEMISDSHAAMGDLATAREMLLKAYEKTPMGRKLAYKLSELSIRLGDLDGAVDFYEDFCKMAPHDNDRFLLKYKIGKAGGVGKKDLAKVLAAYCSREVDEKWMAELASLYDELGEKDRCNEVCDDIILWYADGEYVQKALEMKGRNGVLTASQQSKLEKMQAAAKAPAVKAPEEDLPEMEILGEEREFRPGTIENDDALTEEALDSILEEFITIEDATAPPEPVNAEDMAEISYVEFEEPETEVIPVDEIRVSAEEAGNTSEEIASAKAEAKKAAAIEAVTIAPMLATPEVKEEVMETPTEIQNEPIIEDIELRTAPVHAEVREHIAENMDQPETVDVPDILAAPEEEAVIEEAVVEEEPVFTRTTPNGRPFSNIEAMQSARTAPPKDETNFWKMPEELTIDEEQGGEVFVEPVYGSHRWFEEKKEPEPEFEEPVFGAHRFVPQPEIEEEEIAEDVVIEQVEPEPIVIEQAEEDNALPEHFSTIRTTSSGAELLGMYAAAKSAGTVDNLSAQAAFVRKPELGGRKTLPPEMFADPTTEPEYYEGPEYFEEAESGYEPEPEAEPMIQNPAFVTEAIPKIMAVPEEAFAEEAPAAEFEMPEGEPTEAEKAISEFDMEPETAFIPAAEVRELLKEEEIEDYDISDAGSQLMDELFKEDSLEGIETGSDVVFLQDVTEEPRTEILTKAIEEAAAEFDFEEPAEAEAPVEEEAPAEEAAVEAEEPEAIPDLAAHVAEVMEEEEADRPSPFMFSVMPHESIEEKVPEIVRAKAEIPEAVVEAAVEAPVAEIPEEAPDSDLEAVLDEELEAFEKDLLEEPTEFEKGVEELELVNYPEAVQREEPENYVEVLKPIADTGLIEDVFEDEIEAPEEETEQPAVEEAAVEEIPVEEPIEEAPVEEVEPEAEPSVFIPLNQLAEERGKVITPVTEKSIAAAEIDAEADAVVAEIEEEFEEGPFGDEEFEEEPFEEEFEEEEEFFEEEIPEFDEEPAEEEVSEFEKAEQDFELSHAAAGEPEWADKYASSALQVDEAPIEEITTPIPKEEVEDILDESEAGLEAAVAAAMAEAEMPAEEVIEEMQEETAEPEEELSDFEKAMRAFDAANNAVPEEEFTPDELDEAMEEFIDEGVEPWAEPEFGMPDFEDSEFAKPAYLGNDFDTSEEYQADDLMEEAEAKEEEELSGFEAALAAFEREQREAAIEPRLEEPELEPVEEAEPFAAEPAAEEPDAVIAPKMVVEAPKTVMTKAYELPDDLREELSEFLLIDGMEDRICNTIGSIIERKREGDPTGGHMIITGDAKSGKTYLTISIIKAVGKEIGSSTGRVAKVKADALNGKDMNKVFGKIAGSDLIIENAGYLNDETVRKLIEAIKTSGTTSMVVLEGNELGIDNILTKHPELSSVFHTRLNLNELSLSQWADLACDYAKSKGYKVGDMALLALHAKIDEMNLPTTRLVVEDVQGIIDKAIEKAKKRSSGRLFGGKKNKGNAKELDETDFM